MHQRARFSNRNAPIQIYLDCKEQVLDAVAAAVLHENLTHNFAYNKTRFMGLVKTLIELGQSYSATSSIDKSSLFPTGTVVWEEVLHLLGKRNGGTRNEINEILHMGEGISYHGVKVECNENEYFDSNVE